MVTALAPELDEVVARCEPVLRALDGAELLITGGTGFYGCSVLELLDHARARLGVRLNVTLLTRDPVAFATRAPHLAASPMVRTWSSDVRTVAPDGRTFSHVIHAAAEASAKLNDESPEIMVETILEGTRRVLQIARGASRFLFASSGAVYGKQGTEHVGEDAMTAPDPMDRRAAYANGKRMAEHLCALSSGPDVIIARGFAFVGPYLPLDRHFAIGNFLADALAGRPVVVSGDGTAVRSYLYGLDLAEWLLTLLVRGVALRPYNVGSERAVSIGELARLISSSFGVPFEVRGEQVQGAAVHRYVPSTLRCRSELGLVESVSLEDALKRTARFHLSVRGA